MKMSEKDVETLIRANKLTARYLDKWIEILLLSHWDIRCQVLPNLRKAGRISRDYRYLQANISISGSLSKEEIELTVCHELLHILVGELTSTLLMLKERLTPQGAGLFNEAEERVVEKLSRILINLGGDRK